MSLIGWLTASVTDTTMAHVEDGALLGPRQLDMGNSGSDLRADFALPRNSVTSSSSNSWISRWTWPRTQSSNCSHSGLDSDLLLVLLFPIGGVSPLLGLEPVLFRERVHRLTVYTLFEDTSSSTMPRPMLKNTL